MTAREAVLSLQLEAEERYGRLVRETTLRAKSLEDVAFTAASEAARRNPA